MAATTPRRVAIKHAVLILAMALLTPLPASGADATPAPRPDTGLLAELTAPDVVRLSWQPAAEASGYEVDVTIDGLGTATIATLGADVTDWEDLRAPADTDLRYTVRAVGSEGTHPAADVSITTGARQPDPISVTVEADTTAATSALIGPDGGQLSVSDAAGVTYLLQIPPGALDAETELTMTPATATDGWPLEEAPLGLVSLEPAGLVLAEPATLTITAASTSGNAPVLGFGLSGSAAELGLIGLAHSRLRTWPRSSRSPFREARHSPSPARLSSSSR